MQTGSLPPPELLGRYPGAATGKVLPIAIKKDKAIWQVGAADRKFILKRMRGSPERVRFVVAAMRHLRDAGALVPRVLPDREGAAVLTHNGASYVAFEFLHGRQPRYGVDGELRAIMAALARFHRLSRGFAAPPESKPRDHLGTWPAEYSKQLQRLELYGKRAAAGSTAFDRLFLRHADAMRRDGTAAAERLARSSYLRWVEQVRADGGLCHQDFAAGNLLIGPGGEIYVYDLDSVTFDVPARDLRKILNKVMKKRSGGWSAPLAQRMLDAYRAESSLTAEQRDVLLIDVAFPHLFVGVVDKYYRNRAPDWSQAKFIEKMKTVVRVEESKRAALAQLERGDRRG